MPRTGRVLMPDAMTVGLRNVRRAEFAVGWAKAMLSFAVAGSAGVAALWVLFFVAGPSTTASIVWAAIGLTALSILALSALFGGGLYLFDALDKLITAQHELEDAAVGPR